MTGKIFVGILVFMSVFAAAGLVLINEGVLPDQEANGTGRMQVETRAQLGRSIEAGALLFLNNCVTCHGPNGDGIAGKGPVINPGLFTQHWAELKAGGYGGTLRDFVKMTIAAGRPVQSEWAAALGGYAQRMPTWSQQYGGPLRDDQVNDLVNFVMNWEAEANAGPSVPLNFKPAGSDTTTPLPAGDATRGADLFAQKVKAGNNSNVPCKACHSLQPGQILVGPSLAGIGTLGATREPGKSAADYIRESIQNPNAYLVSDNPTYLANGKSAMPAGLGNSLSDQDLADIIAYLASLK
ncbi:MAG: cytochrome c [Thermoflexales bacterium]|nr:cytochrome c [Thermoflexales bacterium]